MEVRFIASSPDAPRDRQYVSSYLVNGAIAIDAGCIGYWGSPQQQSQVRHVFITHTHMDHIASLPIFLDNAYDPGSEPPTLHAMPEILRVLQDHIFNGKVWPDFLNMKPGGHPFVNIRSVEPGTQIEIEGLRILPVQVNHLVPTVGYIVSDGKSTVVFSSDTGPTSAIWEAAREFPEPRTILIEASFPNSMKRLAELSFHLTPEMLAEEAAKFPPTAKILVMHIKPRFRQQIEAELKALRIPGLSLAECDGVYHL
jgi:ribonuclease BN (tRNA processing enzyme)